MNLDLGIVGFVRVRRGARDVLFLRLVVVRIVGLELF